MFRSLHSLAKRLQDDTKQRRTWRAIAEAQSDPHLARDMGLPHRPKPTRRTDLW